MGLVRPSANPVALALAALASGRQRGISAAYGASLCEAASVCIDGANHPNPATFKVDGHFNFNAQVNWVVPSKQAINTWNDEEFTTEQGAYGVAALLVEAFGLEVVLRSKKGTGFDYWLAPRNGNVNLFQNLTRLEVSGIRAGEETEIASRTRIKLNQTKKSDDMAIPAVVAVVEFSNPAVRISER